MKFWHQMIKVGTAGTFLPSWLEAGRRCGCGQQYTWFSAYKYSVYSNVCLTWVIDDNSGGMPKMLGIAFTW
jgi:hypothetical protein